MKFVRTLDDGTAELNLTPILDCFTVLVAYLMVGGAIAAYAVLDTQLVKAPGADSPDGSGVAGSPGSIDIFFAADGTLFFRGELETAFPPVRLAVGTAQPEAPIERALASVAKRFPAGTEAILSGAPTLGYGTFARNVGIVRRHFRSVSLRAP